MQRNQAEFQLHDYVIMPDHLHLLTTPVGPLERTAQLIKGGFSFQAKRKFEWKSEIWQRGFADHRIRDEEDFDHHIMYIQKNLSSLNETLRLHSGRHAGNGALQLHPPPPRLKPASWGDEDGAAEAAPFQDELSDGSADGEARQDSAAEAYASTADADGKQNSF